MRRFKHSANHTALNALDMLDVRVVLRDDEAGRRCVEVATALSLPRRFAYMAARRYKKMLWGETG